MEIGKIENEEQLDLELSRPYPETVEHLKLFGSPTVSLGWMLARVVEWLRRGAPTLNKPTKYQVRDGRF